MPNKFITNLDLARQADIFSGETAVFQGGMQLGIPFSGFPTGVDTGTTVSLGVVDTQFAAFSGNTGTTVFNVTDPSSPYYSATATTLTVSPYTVIDNDSITETVSATTYSTIMTFTALSGDCCSTPISVTFSPPIIQELYNRGLYNDLFDGLGQASIGTTYNDESFYNDGSIFSGANLNMEIIEYGPHGITPAWVTGTTSGTVVEYSALTQYWTDTDIINFTSGLTLPITPTSADTQTSDYVWTLTQSTIIDENLIGLQYTGYSVTYSFDNVIIDPESPSVTGLVTGATSADTYYLGTTTATLENFSAGTLDYKGSTNWLTIDGNATVTERLTVDRMTIDNPGTGTPINNIGITVDGDVVFGTTGATVTGLTFNDTTYDLTVSLDNGDDFTDSLAILASDIKVTGGTFNDTSGEMTFVNNSGGTFVVSGLSTDFTGNTSGTCITDLHISNLHSCSPLYVNPLDEGNIYFGSTSGVTIDVANNRIGIGTETPSSQLHIAGSGANTIIRVQSEDQNNAVINLDTQTTGGAGPRNSLVQFQQNSITQWMVGMNGLAGGTEEDNQLVIANGTDFDSNNILNINPSNGYVGLGVQAPTERLDINGNIKITGDTIVSGNSIINDSLSVGPNASNPPSYDVEIGNNYDGTTSLAISNINNTSNSISQLSVRGKDSSGAVGSGSLSYYGPNFVPSGTLLGTFIPESLSLLTGGGSTTNRAHINLASRRSDGEVRVFTGSDDLDTSSIRLKIGNSNTTLYNDLIISGELNIGTVGATSSVTNLGVDSSGNVVSGNTATVFWKYGTDGEESLLPNYTGTTSDAKSDYSSVFGGQNNLVETGSTSSSIVGGNNNTIDDISRSTIIGGSGNTLTWGYTISPSSNGGSNSIISSTDAILSGLSRNSVILGGNNNKIYDPSGSILTQSDNSAIIGGVDNFMNAVTNSAILGGRQNSMVNTILDSVIITGSGNTVDNAYRSVILGGQGITASDNDTVYTPDLIVSGDSIVSNNSTVNNDLLVSGDADFAGGILQTGINLYGTSTLAINLTNKSIVRFELDGTISGPSIAAGSAGQRIILYVEVVTTAGTTTISVPGGLGFTQIVFSSLADSVEMIYDSGNWVVLSSRGATIS